MPPSRRLRTTRAWVVAVALTAAPIGVTGAQASTQTATAARSSTPQCGKHGKVSIREVHDSATGRREVWVYTPPGSTGHTPVIYLLHGLPGSDRDFADADIVEDLDDELCSTPDSFIVAAPDGTTPDDRDTEWADSPDGKVDLETFVTGNLISAVEGAHRRPVSLRSIGGFSMGGFGAMAIALRHRNLYSTVIGISGYYTIDDPDHSLGTTTAQEEQHDPHQLLSHAKGLNVLLAEGSDDPLQLISGQAARFGPVLRAAGAVVSTRRVAGGHDLGTLGLALPLALDTAAD